MCTVTYVPIQNGFLLTSSRDEKVYRATLLPKEYSLADQKLIYPKDEVADGTWISHSSNKRIACLLNGGFENHIKQKKYRKSRGLILLESFDYITIDSFITSINLEQIEPFTMLLIDYKDELYHRGHFDETKVVVPEDYALTLIHALKKYTGKHPRVMQQRIANVNWVFDYDESKNKLTLKDHFKNISEKIFGRRLFDYRNYKII